MKRWAKGSLTDVPGSRGAINGANTRVANHLATNLKENAMHNDFSADISVNEHPAVTVVLNRQGSLLSNSAAGRQPICRYPPINAQRALAHYIILDGAD